MGAIWVARDWDATLYQRFITPVSRATSSSAPAISNNHASQSGMALSFLRPELPEKGATLIVRASKLAAPPFIEFLEL